MARPIEATPTLYGEDAARLREEVKKHCTPEEAALRSAWAAKAAAAMTRLQIPTPAALDLEIAATHAGSVNDECAVILQIVRGHWPCRRTTISRSVPERLQKGVAARFAERGWRVTFHDDQREGAWIEVVPDPI